MQPKRFYKTQGGSCAGLCLLSFSMENPGPTSHLIPSQLGGPSFPAGSFTYPLFSAAAFLPYPIPACAHTIPEAPGHAYGQGGH